MVLSSTFLFLALHKGFLQKYDTSCCQKITFKMIIASPNIITLEFIFTQVSLKVDTILTNGTGELLLLDRLDKKIKIYVLKSILQEMKKLSINLIYYSSYKTPVQYKVDRFLQLILIRVYKRLRADLVISSNYFYDQYLDVKWLIKNFEMENGELLKLFLNYLVLKEVAMLGIYSRKKINLEKLLSSILENILLKFSDVILYTLVLNKVPNLIFKEFSNLELCSLKSQKNNFYWSSYLRSTFFKPKYIYTGTYILKIMNYHGFSHKLVYLPKLRAYEEKNVTSLQFVVLAYFELVDFIFPKINNLLNFLKLFMNKKLSVYP